MKFTQGFSSKSWAKRAAAIGIIGAVALGGAASVQAHDNGAGKSRGTSPLTALVSAGTISAANAESVKTALEARRDANKASHQSEMKAARDTALAALVAAGTITQSQADAVKASDSRGLRDLVSNGTLTMADVTALKGALEANRDANKAAHEAKRKTERTAALASLVSAGTITQSQSTAIAAALDAAPQSDGHRGGKHGGRR